MDTQPSSSQNGSGSKPPEVVTGIPSGATPAFDAQDIKDNKLVAALSYLGLLVLIPLFVAQKSPFAREHVKQGVIVLALNILVSLFLSRIPVVGSILWLLIAIVVIVAIVKCLMGQFWEIPVIGPLRKMIKLKEI